MKLTTDHSPNLKLRMSGALSPLSSVPLWHAWEHYSLRFELHNVCCLSDIVKAIKSKSAGWAVRVVRME